METNRFDDRVVGTIGKEKLSRIIYDLLPFCFKAAGANQADSDMNMISNTLADELLDPINEHRTLFMEEVKRALWDGAKGKLGDFYGINPRSLIGFIMKYEGSDFQKKLRPLIRRQVEKYGPKKLEAHKRSQSDIDAQTAKYIKAFADKIEQGASITELFNCYTGKKLKRGDLFKAFEKHPIEGLVPVNRYDIAHAYLEESRRLLMDAEALIIEEFMQTHELFG